MSQPLTPYLDHPISSALSSALSNEKNTPAVYAMEKALKQPFIQSGNAKYAYKKALNSLVSCPTYISSLAEAIKLPSVGPGTGGIMVKANHAFHGRPDPPSVPNSPAASSVASSTASSPGRAKPKKRNILKITKSNQTAKHTKELESAKAKCAKLITKLGLGVTSEDALALSQSSTESNLLSQYTFTPILLIDSREQSSDHVTSQLLQSNVTAEVRTLPIGDMLWVIKVEDRFGKNCGEFLGGVVIERKTMEDLAGSLNGTRFNEQRLRLKLSAKVETKIYLVEGVGSTRDVVKSTPKTTTSASTSTSSSTAKTSNSGMYPLVENTSSNQIRSAVMDTMLHMNFSVVRTRNIDDTINQLRRLHWRILERLWPSSDDVQTQYKVMPKIDEESWVSYDVLDKQVKHDRIIGTKSISAVTSAMLIQIKSLSVKKVKSIVARYPTMKKVREALRVGGLVGGIPLERNGSTARTVGAQSEIEMRLALFGREKPEKKEQQRESSWAEIKKKFAEELSNRTNVQIKDRWRTLKKFRKAVEKEAEEETTAGGGGGGGEACIDLTQDSYNSEDTVTYREPQALFSPASAPPQDRPDPAEDMNVDGGDSELFTNAGFNNRKKKRAYGKKSSKKKQAEAESEDSESSDSEDSESANENTIKPKKKRYGTQSYRRNPTLGGGEERRALEAIGGSEAEAVIDLT